MLYLKNCLVNLTIILLSLFFLTVLYADDVNFILPKKKVIPIKVEEKKQSKVEISKNFKSSKLPQKNPLRANHTQQKKLKDNVKILDPTTKNVLTDNVKISDPTTKNEVTDNPKIQNKLKPFLEKETRNKVDQLKKENNPASTKQIVKSNNNFLYPSKKPLIYSNISTKTKTKSKILKEKDYNLAKNIFLLIKKKKME